MLRRRICAWALTALLALVISDVALAHAVLVRTDPADGSVLAQAPHQVRFWFSEAVLLNFTSMSLMGSDGHEVPLSNLRADPADPKVLIVDLPRLAPKAYRLTWRTLSDDDLHATTGSIVFGVQQAADLAPVGAGAAAPSALEVVLRWLNFIALAGLTGSLALALLCLPGTQAVPNSHDTASTPLQASEYIVQLHRRLPKLALGNAGLALIVGAGLLFVQSNGDGNALIQVLTQSSYGAHWLMRQGWLIVISLILVFHLHGHLLPEASSQVLLAVMTPLIVALVISQTLTSHAAAASDAAFIPVFVDALHLLAASLWVGGLLALAIVIAPLLRREKALARSILRRFSVLAASSVAVLAITGLLNSGQQVASLDALLFTFYGQALLLKTALVMGVMLIALINSALVHPWVADVIRRVLRHPVGWAPLPPRFLRRTIVLESIGAAIVVLFAAMLSAAPPARGPEFAAPLEEATQASISASADDLFIAFSIKPNQPGQNFVTVGIFDTRRPAPAPIERVAVRLQAPAQTDEGTTLIASATDKNHYQIIGNAINAPGEWQITVIVNRHGLPDAVLNVPWRVTPLTTTTRARPAVVSNQPLTPPLTLAAGLLALCLIGIAGGIWLTRRIRTTASVQRFQLTRHLRPLRRG